MEKKNSENGEIIERSYEVDGHMYLINEIRNRDIERLSKIGALRNTKKVNYPELPPNSVAERLKAIGLYETRQKLDCYETIRNFAVWSDHSDIVSHSPFLFLISWLYDTAWCLSNTEYQDKHPRSTAIDVHSIVEKPHLYILARCGSGLSDQAAYSSIRMEDLQSIEPMTMSITAGIPRFHEFSEMCLFFTGDGPQRGVECGQQQGGNYACQCGVLYLFDLKMTIIAHAYM